MSRQAPAGSRQGTCFDALTGHPPALPCLCQAGVSPSSGHPHGLRTTPEPPDLEITASPRLTIADCQSHQIGKDQAQVTVPSRGAGVAF